MLKQGQRSIKRYDFAFSLGEACSCTGLLRKLRLQYKSFPFDWLYGSTLLGRVRLLLSGINGWIDKEDLVSCESPDWHQQAIYENVTTGIVFNHDFPKNVPLDDCYGEVYEKYKRRFARLYKCIMSSKSALIVYLGIPTGVRESNENVLESLRLLKNKFPAVEFEFVYFRYKQGLSIENRKEVKIGNNITIIEFDYKDYASDKDYLVRADLLKRVMPKCRVKDYRTISERLKRRISKLRTKYAKYGAINFGQYTILRLSRHFNDMILRSRYMVKQVSCRFRKLAIKYHKNFVSLGYNCELAYRYNLNNGFVDSGLFQWSYSCSCDDLIFALNHLNLLFTGEILDPNPLYECANTHIRLHGKFPMNLWMEGGAGTSEQKEADKAELVERVAYLKKKFVNTLHEGGALVMYKMRSVEALAPNAVEKVRTIIATLRKLEANEFDFVLVLENKCRGRLQFDKSERVYVRYVREFNPDGDVSNKKIGDFYGWKCIFNEFRPAQKKKNAHKFKFEK